MRSWSQRDQRPTGPCPRRHPARCPSAMEPPSRTHPEAKSPPSKTDRKATRSLRGWLRLRHARQARPRHGQDGARGLLPHGKPPLCVAPDVPAHRHQSRAHADIPVSGRLSRTMRRNPQRARSKRTQQAGLSSLRSDCRLQGGQLLPWPPAGPVHLGTRFNCWDKAKVPVTVPACARDGRASVDARGSGKQWGMLRCGPAQAGTSRDVGPGFQNPPTSSRGNPLFRSRSKGRQGSGFPWSQMPEPVPSMD